MKLTLHTEYSLRVLIYLLLHDGKPTTISDISTYYSISRNHLVKIVHNLGCLGMISTTRGKGGGISLVEEVRKRNLAEIIRLLEPNPGLVDCGSKTEGTDCAVLSVCKLNSILNGALRQFFSELEAYTVNDLIKKDVSTLITVEKINS